MKWKSWGHGDATQISSDWRYSVYRGVKGWTAWQRIPFTRLDRIDHPTAESAMAACEKHAQEAAREPTI